MSDTDLELLARYTRHHAEDAFTELVRRHVDFVHSAVFQGHRPLAIVERKRKGEMRESWNILRQPDCMRAKEQQIRLRLPATKPSFLHSE